ncbi:gas vesicle protein [Pseudonocardia sulfidoxydans NBRC 16205]|uniref:Gas vesicle protein n=1 Tax=Pseudonocardia sulfidoxydans NBRC 16205 TaxID=1223511 RepID=A0A511DK41_9PSEU|nr:GvpL/GvpF family gas vesicle protein [Pseudonocardia sulfidoxydans]GEL23408.1 gas vesicle protein [Pseudonocardia sulfidoxydans NBRC 16205]
MSLVWVYAVQESGAGDAPQVSGVDGERPRIVGTERLGAVVGTVADDGFDEAGLAAAMEDLARIEMLVRAHHGVVAATAEDRTVAPVRLATVFRDDDAVVHMLRERGDAFCDVLDRIRERREWGVKVYVDGAAAGREPASEPGPAAAADRPGTSYLLRRRADRDRSAAVRASARAVADRVAGVAREHAVDVRRFAPQDARLSGRDQEIVLNATFLVDRAREQEFRDAVSAAGAGAVVEMTGPWPPFSFADEGQS